MAETPQSLADRLRDEGSRVAGFFKNLSLEQWDVLVYPPDGDWTMHTLLAHIVSSEIGRGELIGDVVAGGSGAPPGFDIDDFNQQEVHRLSGKSNDYLLELFSQERANLVELVSSLEPADLERIGNDPYLGVVPLLEIIKLTYIHLQIHLREARRRI